LTTKEQPKSLQVTQAQLVYGILALLAIFFVLVKPVLAILALLALLYLHSMHLSAPRKSSPFRRKDEHANNPIGSELTAAALSVSRASESVLDDVAASMSRLKSEKEKRVRFLA